MRLRLLEFKEAAHSPVWSPRTCPKKHAGLSLGFTILYVGVVSYQLIQFSPTRHYITKHESLRVGKALRVHYRGRRPRKRCPKLLNVELCWGSEVSLKQGV